MTVLTTSLRACALGTYLHASCEKPPGRSNVTCYQITLCLTAAKHHFYQEFCFGVSRGTSAFYSESSSLEMTVAYNVTSSVRFRYISPRFLREAPGRSNVTFYQITLCLTAARSITFIKSFCFGVSRGTSAFYSESNSLEMTVPTTSLRACAIGTYLHASCEKPLGWSNVTCY